MTAFDWRRFSAANRLRCESPEGFNHKIADWSASDWMVATFGELGEAANVVKKLNRERDGIAGNSDAKVKLMDQLTQEFADTFIYLDLMAQALGIDLPAAVVQTFNAKSWLIGSCVRVDDAGHTVVLDTEE